MALALECPCSHFQTLYMLAKHSKLCQSNPYYNLDYVSKFHANRIIGHRIISCLQTYHKTHEIMEKLRHPT